MNCITSSRCRLLTFNEVSSEIFHSCGAILQNSLINLLLSRGSPPPNVTPPPVAKKYKLSMATSSLSSCGVIVRQIVFLLKHCGLMQYLQRSRHP